MKAAFSGLRAWALQRASALAVLLFILYVVLRLLLAPPDSFEAWRGWIGSGGMRVGILFFIAAVALHAWVGMRDVILDYVKPVGPRLGVLALLLLGLALTVAWTVLTVLSL
jgi:succinate dehydrogenase / fumarate reductase, membrane anchor subunit